jgi:signal transduction histidine kinase
LKLLLHRASAIVPAREMHRSSNRQHAEEASDGPRVLPHEMKSTFGVRLWLLIAALLAVASGIIYGLFSAWQEVQQLEANLTSSRVESFRIAGEVQGGLLNLHDSMLQFVIARNPEEWTEFQRASSNLNRWIDRQDPSHNPQSSLTTERERQLLQELNRAYDHYLQSAQSVYSNDIPAFASSNQFTQLNDFNAQARRMRNLAQELSEAHRTAEAGFLAQANSSLAMLENILVLSVGILLALVAAMGSVIYRDTIAPLRTRLVQSQKLLEKQEKLATLGTLAAGIAHEIRNPLTSLKARVYTLEKHLAGLPATRKDTEIISAEISRLERIVQDVLSFARPSEPKLEILSGDRILREVEGLMSQSLEERGIKLVLDSNPELRVRADGAHLKQVLINLVRNGADAIDGAGTVTLRTRAARAPLGGGDRDVVVLEVSDTGKGISPEAEKRLFDPFFSTKETGTGLGLAIAARIVEKHGGAIQYQTRPGHGTTFGIVLPRAVGETTRREEACANV